MTKPEAKFWFNLGHKMQFSADFDETWAQYEASHGPDIDGLLEALEREGFVEELGEDDIVEYSFSERFCDALDKTEPYRPVPSEWAKEQGFPSTSESVSDRLKAIYPKSLIDDLADDATCEAFRMLSKPRKEPEVESDPEPENGAPVEAGEVCGGYRWWSDMKDAFLCSDCNYWSTYPSYASWRNHIRQ